MGREINEASLPARPLQTLPFGPIVPLSVAGCLFTIGEACLSPVERESPWCWNSGHMETRPIRGHTITKCVASVIEVEMEVGLPLHR